VAKQKFGLGRGLDALIAGASEVMAPNQPSRIDAHTILQATIDSIIPNPRQPRRAFREDDLRLIELSESIKEHGLLQPIVVTRLDSSLKGKKSNSWFSQGEEQDEEQSPAEGSNVVLFQIIAGERRWRAARIAGLTQVPVVIKEVTPQQMLELALIENIQRADLNPIEEALAYHALVEEFGLTQEMVAKQVGKDRSTITNAIRLLQLVPKVREALMNQPENFSEGHARALIGITREEDQVTAMQKIISMKLNVRQAEALAASIKAAEKAQHSDQEMRVQTRRPAEMDSLEEQFREALMVKVDLKRNQKGRGTLVLHFNNQEELERLYSRIVKNEEQ
jgi:ParB family chromosome partitioning protein